MTIIFGFEDGTTQGWIGEGSAVVSSGAPTGRNGTGSLKVMGEAPIIRVNDANSNTMSILNGRELAAWVLVPPGITGNWKAHMEMQDGNFASHGAADVPLVVGQWTELRFTPSDAVWSDHKGVAIQFSGENAPAGFVPLYVDSFEQIADPVVVPPPPPPTAVERYLATQRRMTAALIANDPTTAALIPSVRTRTPGGGYTDTPGTPRASQTFKLSLLAYDQRPTITVAGVERVMDYHLIGPHDMAIEVDDYWEDEAGTRYEIAGFTEGWDYMTKAFVFRNVPREARP